MGALAHKVVLPTRVKAKVYDAKETAQSKVETVRQHLRPGSAYFAPTPEWDTQRSNDRPWS